MNQTTKQLIAIQLIKCLYLQLDRFPQKFDTNFEAILYEQFLNSFSQKTAKVSFAVTYEKNDNTIFPFFDSEIGQSFFENVAHILCGGEKKEFTTNRKNNLLIEQTQKTAIAKIITDLSNDNIKPSLDIENTQIFDLPKTHNLIEGTDFTADVFFENATEIVCIEIKTVKPNKGVFKVEKQKILEAKASLKLRYPDKEIKYFLAFPFDPLSDVPCAYDKKRFMDYSVGFTKYFDEKEILLSSELWDFLAGNQNTMQEILDIINTIAMPNFMNELKFLSENKHKTTQRTEYLALLEKWFLYQEKEMIEKENQILLLLNNKTIQNIFTQNCFKNGEYKLERVRILLALLS